MKSPGEKLLVLAAADGVASAINLGGWPREFVFVYSFDQSDQRILAEAEFRRPKRLALPLWGVARFYYGRPFGFLPRVGLRKKIFSGFTCFTVLIKYEHSTS